MEQHPQPPRTPKDTEIAMARAATQRPLLHEELTGLIRQTAFEIHRYFGGGFLKKVYENALANRLRKSGQQVIQQQALAVYDEDGTPVGHYNSDLVVNASVVIEIKAVKTTVNDHVAQLLNYLKVSRMQLGLLVNFGGSRLEFRRFVFTPSPSASSVSSVARVPQPEALSDLPTT